MAHDYRVVISHRVYSELGAILEHVAADSPASAAHLIDVLRDAMYSLDRLPYRYPIYQGHRRPATAVRRMLVASYWVYYRVNERQTAVGVITVRHVARRQPQRFN